MTQTAHSLDAKVLARSYAYCKILTRKQAKNFYYGLKLLPEPKRSAMYALYAYMRLVDDIADDDDRRSLKERIEDLEAWRTMSHAVMQGQWVSGECHEVWAAFAELVRHYHIPAHLFDDMIAGQRQDLQPVAIETFQQLHEYCYRVASVVGLASIYVWSYTGGAETEKLAVDRGIAFQLTNVLRDLREDAKRGRVYLPAEDLQRFGVKPEQLAHGPANEAFNNLMRFEIDRAQEYYRKSAPLEERIAADSRPTLIAMTDIYHQLLEKIAVEPGRVLHQRVSLSLWAKLSIGWRAMRHR